MRLISHNPCSDVGKLNERRDRRQARPLSYDEEDRVKEFSPPLLRMLITLLAETGLRVEKANCQMEGIIYENGVPIRFCTKG
jgi:hypothetical protein